MMFILVSFIINSKSYLWPLYVLYCIQYHVLCVYLCKRPRPSPNLSPGKEEKRRKGKERKKKKEGGSHRSLK